MQEGNCLQEIEFYKLKNKISILSFYILYFYCVFHNNSTYLTLKEEYKAVKTEVWYLSHDNDLVWQVWDYLWASCRWDAYGN